jgi:hypothetical protein
LMSDMDGMCTGDANQFSFFHRSHTPESESP